MIFSAILISVFGGFVIFLLWQDKDVIGPIKVALTSIMILVMFFIWILVNIGIKEPVKDQISVVDSCIDSARLYSNRANYYARHMQANMAVHYDQEAVKWINTADSVNVFFLHESDRGINIQIDQLMMELDDKEIQYNSGIPDWKQKGFKPPVH